MGELFGLSSILRGVGVAYIIFALVCLALAIYLVKGSRGKSIAAVVVLAIFSYVPVTSYIEKRERDAYAAEAWAYFKKLCNERSGEKIVKTYPGVKSVLVVKPLKAASEQDLYDQFWYGDPYSDATPWAERGKAAASTLTLDSRSPDGQRRRGLDFVELQIEQNGNSRYEHIARPVSNDKKADSRPIGSPTSRFAVYWEDISRPSDRKYWIAGSRFRVVDLADDSLVAERIGFLLEAGFGSTAGQRRPWLAARGPSTTCPPVLSGEYSDNWFIARVFPRAEEK